MKKISSRQKKECIEMIEKATATTVDASKNFDLYPFKSILASVGGNNNDDYFLPLELWKAKDTPVNKPVNIKHFESEVIGVIVESYVVDEDGNVLTEYSDTIKDVVTKAVLWSYWTEEALSKRFKDIAEKIESEQMSVSMECLFKNFDYVLVKDDKVRVIERTKDTKFLTKYLKRYGGSGFYNDYRIYRGIKDFVFSAKAVTQNPASARSIISDMLPDNDLEAGQATKTKLIAEKIMDHEQIIADLRTELEAAKAELTQFQTAKAESVSAEIAGLQKQVAELTALAQEAKAETKKAMEDAKASEDEMKAKCEAEVAEAKAEIATLKAEKIVAERMGLLMSANIDSAKAETIINTWASASDEQFKDIVALHTEINTKSEAPSKAKAEGDFELEEENVDKSTASTDLNLAVGLEIEAGNQEVASQKALAERIAEKLNFKFKSRE